MNAITHAFEKSEDVKVLRIKKLESSKLFEASKEVMIEHDSEIYFLRLTRQNKLILTK
jgi:hemin uptake protein HemP